MKNHKIEIIYTGDAGPAIIDNILNVFEYEYDEEKQSNAKWFSDWFNGIVKGEKFTVIALQDEKIIGICRFWSSPFCDNEWLIEGLETKKCYRNIGLAISMINYGINELKNREVSKIQSNIDYRNLPSIRLHEKLGFQLISNGSNNSFGDFRENSNRYQLMI
ncbi:MULTISPECIES: GNAT family N-acetyltransferase [unclassified Fusibacter]|uniref:GNAT family N-acetyltransferase n=1 Tax=unclassified Fusibacter TaxID=2624464 RepID=UPI00101062BE|nr:MULTISPECIES: GNAT family N-acetyltransferase [unclassified Fusibacter]MCK8061147.1 GNAT family N-acetyltransferase [Fusibacter sp. A2]NPE23317.1 GNAT family N-acetyltransferase [Fusibacter sp. A1]RXV59359.1 GNAT family N-acetyltransferase [Fusibacter sp. A1]